MKNLTFLLLLLPALLLHSCKKSSNPPSIVGTWKIAGISGTQTSQSSPTATLINRTYIYTSPVLTVTDTVTTLVTVNNETWAFNSDGTFSIAENYTIGTSVIAVVHNLSGWWDYTSSTLPNSDLLLRSTGTPSLVPIGGTFFIKSVTSTQLVLTVIETNTSSTGSTLDNNFTLTFSRQ